MKVLFLCTHNRCRSILAEAITNQTSDGKIQAASAGSSPAGVVHPMTLKYLEEGGYSTNGLQSQSWDEYQDFGTDVVVTLCDSAAGETCPAWMGETPRVHWGLNDPSKLSSEIEQKAAFEDVIQTLRGRIDALKQKDLSVVDDQLIDTLRKMGNPNGTV